MKHIFVLAAGALSLTACHAANSVHEGPSAYDVAQPAESGSASPAPADAAADTGAPAPLAVKVPQLAYSYRLTFLLPDTRIAEVQEAHRALCDKMSPARCQLIAMERTRSDAGSGTALLTLRVASREARAFSDALTHAVKGAGGRTVDTHVAAEDVSKDIVDTQARIRQRELLVDRLTEILRTRNGKVADLVAAERSVAQAQEELDQAQSWLHELQGRVAMSDFEIRYTAIAPTVSTGSFGDQLREAVEGSATLFVLGLRGLLSVLIYLAPWLLLLVPAALAARAFHRRRTRMDSGDEV